MKAQDFLLDAQSGELVFKDGDFVIGESDGQHIEAIFILEPGELKSNPLVGIGIQKKINGSADGDLRREAYLQLQADGYQVNQLNLNEEIIEIDAERNG